MNEINQLITFIINEEKYALYLSAVERIVRIVEIVRLPIMPKIILGVINVQGNIIPVMNIRKRFNLSEREISLSDQLMIAHTSKRVVALVVDKVIGIIECSQQKIVEAEKILPTMEYVKGIAKLEEDMILIHDLNEFLSIDEELLLDEAMNLVKSTRNEN